MSKALYNEVLDAIKARTEWERRQTTWYQMRHDGLRRRNKPWPNAADMHFPLADMLIEKLKPTFVSQIFATDTIAAFIAERTEFVPYQAACSQWFDHRLKQRSNFEDVIPIAIDAMLQTGKAIVKVLWNVDSSRLEFEPINALQLIVPSWTGPLAEADWIVHVQTYSKAAYKRLKGFATDDETMAKLGDRNGETNTDTYDQARTQREGLTRPKNDDEVVFWEHYVRGADGKWTVHTYSPQCPDIPLRPTFGLPYQKGLFAGKQPPPPFAEINCERKERGYYSPRGVCERVMAFEVSLCKDWNTLKDYQTLTCAPVFSAKNGVPNTANLRMVPGQILPFELVSVTFPPAPMDIHQSMNGTRQLAEQLVAIPDAGVGRDQNNREKRTAAEVNLIGSLMGRNDDTRARMFRRELAHLLNLAWGILLEYEQKNLTYLAGDELMQLPADALAGLYSIEPNGSGDNYNRGLVLQRAIARKQMFTGNGNINQYELDRSVLEADDPRLVKRLLIDTGTRQAEQLEDQAQELSIMLLGFPAQVRPSDDDWAHIESCVGFIQRRASTNEPLGAETLMQVALHVEQHAAALKKKQPQVYQQRGQAVQQFVRTLRDEAQALSQPQAMPGMMPEAAAPAGMRPAPTRPPSFTPPPPGMPGAQVPNNVIPMGAATP